MPLFGKKKDEGQKGYPSQPSYPQQAPPQQAYPPQGAAAPPYNPQAASAPPGYGPPPPYSQQAPPPAQYAPPPQMAYAPPQQTAPWAPGAGTNVVVQGGFDAGARFDGVAQPNIPPPPPGVAPNAAQMAAAQGNTVVMGQRQGNFMTGGSDGGYTIW